MELRPEIEMNNPKNSYQRTVLRIPNNDKNSMSVFAYPESGEMRASEIA